MEKGVCPGSPGLISDAGTKAGCFIGSSAVAVAVFVVAVFVGVVTAAALLLLQRVPSVREGEERRCVRGVVG
jgi:hypothetical protein